MIGGVYYQGEMAIGWQAGAPPSVATLLEWMHTNAVVLHALASMEAQPSAHETEFGDDVEMKLDRVEAKLDLVLNLLSSLLARHISRPRTCPVTLSASTVEWVSHDTAPEKGSIVISLFISPRLHQPLLLPACVRESEPVDSGTRIVADFTHLSEEVKDNLERAVFRNHRRHIQAMHGSRGRQVKTTPPA